MFEDLTPNFVVRINGAELKGDLKALITDITIEKEVGMVDALSVNVTNLNLATQYRDPGQPAPTAEWVSDLKVFAEGNTIEVDIGYGDKLENQFHGVILGWLPDFPNTGIAKLKIKALNEASQMMEATPPKRGKKQWRGMKYDEIIKLIATDYGFDASLVKPPVVAVPKNGVAVKNDISDWDFIKGLANLNAYEFYVDYDAEKKINTLIWGPPQRNQTQVFNLFYNNGDKTTLFNFTPEFNLSQQSGTIEVYGWDIKKAQPILFRLEAGATITVNKIKWTGEKALEAITEQIQEGDAVRLAQFGKSVKVISSSAITTEDQARNMADKILATNRDAFLRGKGTIIGLEKIRPMQTHKLDGVGNRFSGKYYFKGVRHVVSQSSFATHFLAKLISETVAS